MQCAGPWGTDGFIPEVVHAGMDLIPSGDANPEVVVPSISELMARWAAERGDGNLWAKEIHYRHKDLFIQPILHPPTTNSQSGPSRAGHI